MRHETEHETTTKNFKRNLILYSKRKTLERTKYREIFLNIYNQLRRKWKTNVVQKFQIKLHTRQYSQVFDRKTKNGESFWNIHNQFCRKLNKPEDLT